MRFLSILQEGIAALAEKHPAQMRRVQRQLYREPLS